MPNKYLEKKRTSCGTIQAVRYKSSYRQFIKKWDFRKLAKPKLDAIILSTIEIRDDEDVGDLAEMVLSSKTLRSLKNKVEDL